MDSISGIAERYLRAARGEMEASSEFLRRNLIEKFSEISDSEKMKMYRENMGPDNPFLELVKDCEMEEDAWQKIELVEQVFFRAMRDVLVIRANDRHEGDQAGDIHRRAQVALIVKTVVPHDTWVELAPAVR